MKDETKNCSKCQKIYNSLSTECDLCVECVEKYPYFLSFIEESFTGVPDRAFGRIEVHDNKKQSKHAIEEIRFLFEDNQWNTSKIHKEFQTFREKWDFKNVGERELEEIKKIINSNFYNKNL